MSRAVKVIRGNVARCKVARGYVATRYCRRGSVARGNDRAVMSCYAEKYQKYLVQLLVDNRLNDFRRISQTSNFIKSCQIKIFDEIQSKNCTPGELGISEVRLESITMKKRFDFLKLIDKNKVEKLLSD